jgi:hypothetical protein
MKGGKLYLAVQEGSPGNRVVPDPCGATIWLQVFQEGPLISTRIQRTRSSCFERRVEFQQIVSLFRESLNEMRPR